MSDSLSGRFGGGNQTTVGRRGRLKPPPNALSPLTHHPVPIAHILIRRMAPLHRRDTMRMFGPSGNPHARNLFEVISRTQQHEASSSK